MTNLISDFLNSPALIVLSCALALSYSITTLDKRIIQGKRSGTLPANHPDLPKWTIFFHVADWLILIALLLLNWKVGIIVWGILFALKVLPVLEVIGNILMSPFKR